MKDIRNKLAELWKKRKEDLQNETAEETEQRNGRNALGAAVAVIVIIYLILRFPQILFFLSEEQQSAIRVFRIVYLSSKMPGNTAGGFDWLRIVALVLMIAMCWVVNRIVQVILGHFTFRNRNAETLKGLVSNIFKYAIVIFAVLYGLSIMGVNTAALIASLGIMSLIIGFGAQSLIEDVITGLFIILEGQYHVGDIVTIDGFRGTVTSIGIRTTQITDIGGNIKVINNSDIRTLVNLSEVKSLSTTIVSVAYGADLRAAEFVIKETAAKLPEMYPEVFPAAPEYMGVEELNASSVDLKIAASVDESQIYVARRLMNREFKLALDAAGIEIPFPQVVVHEADGPST